MKKLAVFLLLALCASYCRAQWNGYPLQSNDWYIVRTNLNAVGGQIVSAILERASLYSWYDYPYANMGISGTYIASYSSNLIVTGDGSYWTYTPNRGYFYTNLLFISNSGMPTVYQVMATNIAGVPTLTSVSIPMDVVFYMNNPMVYLYGGYNISPLWVSTNKATGGDFNTFFQMTDGGGLHPQSFMSSSARIFYETLGSNYVSSYRSSFELNTYSFGVVSNGNIFGFAEDPAPVGTVLAQSVYTTNGWSFHSYGGVVESSTNIAYAVMAMTFLANPVLTYCTTSTTVPALSCTITGLTQGMISYSYPRTVDGITLTGTNTILLDRWTGVFNISATGAIPNLGDSITLQYTKGSLLAIDGRGLQWNYSFPDHDYELNLTMLNQRYNVLNDTVWIEGGGDWYVENYDWTGSSTNSWAEAIANCQAATPTITKSRQSSGSVAAQAFTSASKEVFWTPDATVNNQTGATYFIFGETWYQYIKSWTLTARNSVCKPMAAYASCKGITNLAHDVDFYVSYHGIGTNLDLQGTSFPSGAITNEFQLSAGSISGSKDSILTNSTVYGSSSFPPDICDEPANGSTAFGNQNIGAGPIGWDSPKPPLVLYKFNVVGGLKYQ